MAAVVRGVTQYANITLVYQSRYEMTWFTDTQVEKYFSFQHGSWENKLDSVNQGHDTHLLWS